MKDELGHGSAARGVNQIGRVLSPNVVRGILSTPPGGGFTMKLHDAQAPTDGFQVAVPGHKLDKPLGGGASDENELHAWAAQHEGALRQAGHVGGYNNEVTGKFEIEPSQNFQSRSHAVRAGKARNQVSIWDNAKGSEIKTGGDGK